MVDAPKQTNAAPVKPRVSMGLPVHNGSRYLAESLESLLAQTYREFELIVCDNCSTDETEQICRSFADRDPRIRYVRNTENLGASGNYRRAFELATGEYFRWTTHDDMVSPNALAECVDVLDQHPDVVLVYPHSVLIDANGKLLDVYNDGVHATSDDPVERARQVINNLGYCNPVYGLIRSSALSKTPLMENYVASDNPLLVELALLGKFWELPNAIFYRRLHPQAWSSITDTQEMVSWYRSGSRGGIVMIEFRQIFQYLVSAWRVPLSITDKFRFVAAVLHRAASRRDRLALELKGALRQIFARP
jgi:glycosyltransferase involved in cell wall biosynthesis